MRFYVAWMNFLVGVESYLHSTQTAPIRAILQGEEEKPSNPTGVSNIHSHRRGDNLWLLWLGLEKRELRGVWIDQSNV
jgi:hypothetical protein